MVGSLSTLSDLLGARCSKLSDMNLGTRRGDGGHESVGETGTLHHDLTLRGGGVLHSSACGRRQGAGEGGSRQRGARGGVVGAARWTGAAR